jgi:hypothetical protein
MLKVLVFLSVAVAFSAAFGPFGGDVCQKAKKLQEICDEQKKLPVCKCDALEECEKGKKAKMEEAMKRCVDECKKSSPISGVDMDKLVQCKEKGKEEFKAKIDGFKDCMKKELGGKKCCDDGSGVVEVSDESPPGPPPHHGPKHGGKGFHLKRFLKKVMPPQVKEFKHCIKKCLHDNKPEPPTGHHPPPMPLKFMKGPPGHKHMFFAMLNKKMCMKELKCRKAKTVTKAEKIAAFKKCHPKPQVGEMAEKMAAKFKEHCACAKDAGLAVDCEDVVAKLKAKLEEHKAEEADDEQPPPALI